MSILSALLLGLVLLPGRAQETETITETFEDGSPKVVRQVRRGADGEWIDHGAYKSYHPTGKVESEGAYEDGLRTGEWTFRWERGKRQAVGSYVKGERSGPWRHYDERGVKSAEGSYSEGHRVGEWTFWNEDKEVDAARSGEYGFERLVDESDGSWWEGESFAGRRTGRWTWHRADGSTRFTGEYEGGRETGPWVFLFPDGSGDGGWISGEYEGRWKKRGLRGSPAEVLGRELPEPDLSRLAVPEVDGEARTLVERFLGGEPDVLEQLRARPRTTYAAVLEKLLVYDLSEARGAGQSRRLNDEVLAAVCGASWDWIEGVEPDAVRANTQSVLRWFALFDLLGPEHRAWKRDFHPDWQWVPVERSMTVLERPPLSTEFGIAAAARLGMRAPTVDAVGGSGTQAALEAALEWIAGRQEESGAWTLPVEHRGNDVATAATALCTLALMGDNPQRRLGFQREPLDGRYGEPVTRALRWLVERQDPETGQFRAGYLEDHYEHVLALHTVADAAYWTRLPALLGATQKGTEFLISVRLEGAGWGVAKGVDESDTLTTAAAWLALAQAWEVGAQFDAKVFGELLFWLDSRTDGTSGRTYGGPYTDLSVRSEGLATLMAILCHELDGGAPSAPVRKKRLDWIAGVLPSEDRTRSTGDPQFLLAGCLAAFQVGGKAWTSWNVACKALIVGSQREDGSWAPTEGSRPGFELIETARLALALEAYWRYPSR